MATPLIKSQDPCAGCSIRATCKLTDDNPRFCKHKPSDVFAKFYKPKDFCPVEPRDLSRLARQEHFIRMSICGNGD